MIFGGILILLISIGGVVISIAITRREDRENVGMAVASTFFGIMGLIILLSGIFGDNSTSISTKDNSLRTEIRIESINGIETSRDTVYIFTPRKNGK